MTLTVEDGTGKSDADAFISLAFADSYHTTYGNSTWTGENGDKEAAIRRATVYLSNSLPWEGYRSNNRDQALAWPRAGVIDGEGIGIDSDEMPIELQNATAEVALRELITPGAMNPDFTASDQVKREKIGQIEVEYSSAKRNADEARPVLLIVRDMIGSFLKNGGSSSLFGSTYRV